MLTLILNPAAGHGYARKVCRELAQVLTEKQVAYQVLETQAPMHACALAAEAAKDAKQTAVIAVGGDGTAYEVACGLVGTGVPMGIIPAGTGNDFIKSTGIPKNPTEALKHILNSTPKAVDIGSLNDRIFLNACGTGFDVTVLEHTESAKRYCRGMLPYLIGLIRAIFTYHPVHVIYTADGITVEEDLLICSIANGRFIGGGIAICPTAQTDDGKLDLITVDNVPRKRVIRYLAGLLQGKILEFDITHHRQVEEITIQSKGMHLNVDGEILAMNEAHFRILPGKLLLY